MRAFVAGLLLVGCSQKLEPVDTNVEADTDTDTDTDTDADADADSDADADVDTGPELDCTAPYDAPAPGSDPAYPACVTERIYCGQTIFQTTEGGSTDYDYDYWLENMNLGSLINKPEKVDGPERIYAIEGVLPGQVVSLRLESCNETWGSWIAMGSVSNYCDEFNQAPKQHFYEVAGRYVQEADVPNNTQGVYSVQVIVDSSAISPGNFFLTVECTTP